MTAAFWSMLMLLAAGMAGERRVVFAVGPPEFSPVPGDAELYMEAIAYADPLSPPPPAIRDGENPMPETSKFVERFFQPARRFAVYAEGGRRLGTVQPLRMALASCVSLGATATGPRDLSGFATNFPVQARALRSRELTGKELEHLRAYGRRFFGRDADAEGEVIDIGEPLIAATITARTCGETSSLFLVAPGVSATRVVPLIAFPARGRACDMAGDPVLFGHLDFDGDGTDEIVIRDSGVEGYDYVVFRRGEDGIWRSLRGGGSGC